MSGVEWLCSRCADKEDKKTEPEPTVLRLCTSCKVENWVRPFAHSGEAMEPTPEEKEEALAFHAQKMKVLKKATENRKAKETENYKEAEKQVLEAETVDEFKEEALELIDDVIEVMEEASDVIDERESEIAKLKAQIAELEK